MKFVLYSCEKVLLASRASHHAILMGTAILDDCPKQTHHNDERMKGISLTSM